MEINQLKQVKVNAKTLRIHMKVRDEFRGTLQGADGAVLKDYEGYVPDFMPEQHYGDYLILAIDIDTGQITNWTKPTPEQIEEFINPKDD